MIDGSVDGLLSARVYDGSSQASPVSESLCTKVCSQLSAAVSHRTSAHAHKAACLHVRSLPVKRQRACGPCHFYAEQWVDPCKGSSVCLP